jgi:hypothetical protein
MVMRKKTKKMKRQDAKTPSFRALAHLRLHKQRAPFDLALRASSG